MGLEWPGAAYVRGDMDEATKTSVQTVIDEFGEALKRQLASLGMPLHTSPFGRPFSLTTLRDSAQIIAASSPATGMAQLTWLDRPGELHAPAALASLSQDQLGLPVSALVSLPLPTDADRTAKIAEAAAVHAKEVETMHSLSKLGDIEHVRHLEPYLRKFLEDHPEPSRNVFIMMRFSDSPQMREIHEAIVAGLAEHGLNAVRADDRDYTGEVWSNIEVYLTGCQYGIAVFEDIEKRDFNPNVSLELGYLMGRAKRSLLLKEKRLPNMPSDVVHRLYKEFDGFDIANSIKREIGIWITRDLRI